MANAIAGVGTVFQRWGGVIWDDIAEINSIEGPNEDRDTIDVTSLDTEGGYDEFITGFMEGGTLVLNMNFNRTGYEMMKQDFEIDLVRNYRIVFPDDEETVLEFEGLVTEIPITMEAENQLTADVTIQVSGEIAIASAGAESSVGPAPSEDISSGGYDADLVTYLAALSTPLSEEQELALNTLITSIKDGLGISNLSDKFDVFYVFANETEEAALKNIVKRAHDAQLVNSPTWTQYEGVTAASTKYIRTNYNPATQGVTYTLTDASQAVYSRTDGGLSTASDCGARVSSSADKACLEIRTATDVIVYALHVDGNPNDSNLTALGLFIATRVSGYTNMYAYINRSTTEASTGYPADVIPNLELFVGCINENGSATRYCARQYSIYFAGAGLTSAQRVVIFDAVEAYMDSKGKGVVS